MRRLVRINLPLFSTVFPQLFDGKTVENKGKLILTNSKLLVHQPTPDVFNRRDIIGVCNNKKSPRSLG
jgi:hypothetical protein